MTLKPGLSHLFWAKATAYEMGDRLRHCHAPSKARLCETCRLGEGSLLPGPNSMGASSAVWTA